MQVRVFCLICEKGLAGDSTDPKYGEKVVQFMIAHETDYKILAAHKDPCSPADQIGPSFAIEAKHSRKK